MSVEASDLVAVRCRLSKGVFSSERAFEVKMADGKSYSGPAPVHFCWSEAGKPIQEGEAIGKEVTGWVAARVIGALEGDQVAVEVPDGEVIAVRASQIKDPTPTPVAPPRAATRA
jgi:hypothetical protein